MTDYFAPLKSVVFIVEGRAGIYEPSFWTVNAWTTRELAEKEVQRLREIARPFWDELQEFERTQYKDASTDEELTAYYEDRDALIKKWTDLSGDQGMSTFDESEYFVTTTELKA